MTWNFRTMRMLPATFPAWDYRRILRLLQGRKYGKSNRFWRRRNSLKSCRPRAENSWSLKTSNLAVSSWRLAGIWGRDLGSTGITLGCLQLTPLES